MGLYLHADPAGPHGGGLPGGGRGGAQPGAGAISASRDLGIDRATLAALNRRIKQSGARSCPGGGGRPTRRRCCAPPARRGRSGSTCCWAGPSPRACCAILQGSGIGYYPFPGRPFDHPTRLGGTADLVERQCRALLQRGCAGVDLLAYRATEAEPLDLVRAARRGLDARRSEGGGSRMKAARRGRLVVAGSIDSPARIQALAAAGPMPSPSARPPSRAAFSPRKGLLRSQLAEILAAARDCPGTGRRRARGHGLGGERLLPGGRALRTAAFPA